LLVSSRPFFFSTSVLIFCSSSLFLLSFSICFVHSSLHLSCLLPYGIIPSIFLSRLPGVARLALTKQPVTQIRAPCLLLSPGHICAVHFEPPYPQTPTIATAAINMGSRQARTSHSFSVQLRLT
jgi:hypothetical protein